MAADGYLFAFPENLAAISGGMKGFFDRCYYPCLGALNGRPYAMIVCAGSDGRNAVAQAERIATGWRLRQIAESRIVCTHAQTSEAILAPKTINEADQQAFVVPDKYQKRMTFRETYKKKFQLVKQHPVKSDLYAILLILGPLGIVLQKNYNT